MSIPVGSAARGVAAPTSLPANEAMYVYRLLLPVACAVVFTYEPAGGTNTVPLPVRNTGRGAEGRGATEVKAGCSNIALFKFPDNHSPFVQRPPRSAMFL